MSAWIAELNAALEAEFPTGPNVAALATVDARGRPRVRSVVCRRIDPDGSAWVASDARSDKNSQVRVNPASEMVFWLPSRREQFRVAGEIAVVSGDDPGRIRLWAEMSDTARALFFWDEPGAPVFEPPGPNPKGVAAVASPPDAFELLVLRADRVEHLDLNRHPHRRRRWEASRGWAERAINP